MFVVQRPYDVVQRPSDVVQRPYDVVQRPCGVVMTNLASLLLFLPVFIGFVANSRLLLLP